MSGSRRGDWSSETTLLSAVVDSWYATESAGHTLPMIGSSCHFRLRERSGLIRVQVSPRSSLRYTYWLAQERRRGVCGLVMYGASQLCRAALGSGAPCPPPRAPPRPVCCCPAGGSRRRSSTAPTGAGGGPAGPPSSPCDAGTVRGRIDRDAASRTSSRVMLPSCDVAYTMFGSSGSLRVWKPSPPPTMYQSLVRTPQRFVLATGPHVDQLSCAPPHT